MWYLSLSDFTQYDHLSKWQYFFFLWLSQGFHRGHTTPDQTWSWTSDPEMTLWQLGKLSRDEPCHLVGCLPSALYRSRTAMEGTMRDPQSHPHLAKRAGSSELWWAGVGCRRSLHGTVSASQLCPLRSHAAAGGLLTSPSLFLHVQRIGWSPPPGLSVRIQLANAHHALGTGKHSGTNSTSDLDL